MKPVTLAWITLCLIAFCWIRLAFQTPGDAPIAFGLSNTSPAYAFVTYGLIHLRPDHLITNAGLTLAAGFWMLDREKPAFVALILFSGLLGAGIAHLTLSPRPDLFLHGGSGVSAAFIGAGASRKHVGPNWQKLGMVVTLIGLCILLTGKTASLPGHLAALSLGLALGFLRETAAIQ